MPRSDRTLALIIVSALHVAVAAQQRVVIEPAVFRFGTVVEGEVIEPVVTIRNSGAAPVQLRGAQMLSPLRATRMPASLGAGETARLTFRLDTSTVLGAFESDVVLLGADDAEVSAFRVEGHVMPIVGSEPGVILLSTLPGERKMATAQVVNRGVEPVEVTVEQVPPGVTARLSTVDAGMRYRLDVESTGTAPAGRHRVFVGLRTTSTRRPTVRVPVNLLVRGRVYTFPDQVDLGRLRTADAKVQPGLLTQTLMVYQQGGRAFQAKFETDVRGLIVSAEPGPSGDRWQATLRLDPVAHGIGEIRGRVTITTNDPDFANLVVPVVGALTN